MIYGPPLWRNTVYLTRWRLRVSGRLLFIIIHYYWETAEGSSPSRPGIRRSGTCVSRGLSRPRSIPLSFESWEWQGRPAAGGRWLSCLDLGFCELFAGDQAIEAPAIVLLGGQEEACRAEGENGVV